MNRLKKIEPDTWNFGFNLNFWKKMLGDVLSFIYL